MDRNSSIGIDNLVDNKNKFVDKIVLVVGRLVDYSIGKGIINLPMELKVKGNNSQVSAYCYLSRPARDHKLILPYLEKNLGEEIEMMLYVNDYAIKELYFNEVHFKVRGH